MNRNEVQIGRPYDQARAADRPKPNLSGVSGSELRREHGAWSIEPEAEGRPHWAS